jgi:hypothetical protein
VTATLAQRTGECGCCGGIAESTPAAVLNLPGLSSLAYRVGTHARFKQSMLVGLSRQAGLLPLTTRDDDDPTIALVDAWAAALDVLTFYQERLANEGYLRTALEPRSIRELARAIGYELGPGVAADTSLAFELETAAGAPASALIRAGTKVQSVPGQDELPQTFETVEEIEARAEWNAIRARSRLASRPAKGTRLYLAGVDTNLRPGDTLVLVGKGRIGNSSSNDWRVRRVRFVEPTPEADITTVGWSWEESLDFDAGYLLGPGLRDVQVYAVRLRAALFGHNAPDWNAMHPDVQTAYKNANDPVAAGATNWPGMTLTKVGNPKGQNSSQQIFLDAVYPQLVEGGWVVLTAPGIERLFNVGGVTEASRIDFTMSAKTTRLQLEPAPVQADASKNFDGRLRDTTVLAQSEPLDLAEWPVTRPVWGSSIELDTPVHRLPEGRRLVLSGLPAYVSPNPDIYLLDFWLDPVGGGPQTQLHEDDVFGVVMLEALPDGNVRWHLDDGRGTSGTVFGDADTFVLVPPPEGAATLTETAVAGPPPTAGELQDTLQLTASLHHVYDRASFRIAANVIRATHGESRTEPLGGGDASMPFQRFALKDKPLTYVQSSGTTGSATSLSVRVNGVLWHEVRSLYGHGPRERVYVVRLDDTGTASVEFGEGTTGARLPTGAQNVRATYRVGTGLDGQVGAGRLTTLLGAALGVKGVTNPLPATGADDPETGDGARENAPLTVRTFERIVSLEDAEDFAAAYAGVGKAQATRLWDGETEIVHLTIGLADGTPPSPDSPTLAKLRTAVGDFGDPHLRVQIDPFLAWPFALEAAVVVHTDYEADVVLEAVRAALLSAFSFERRAFAQSVFESEVISTMQRVEGVEGVDLQHLHLVGEYTMLPAERARFFAGTVIPAQLLTLAPDGVTLTAS